MGGAASNEHAATQLNRAQHTSSKHHRSFFSVFGFFNGRIVRLNLVG